MTCTVLEYIPLLIILYGFMQYIKVQPLKQNDKLLEFWFSNTGIFPLIHVPM